MNKLFFCNIGWMNRYEGLRGKPDKIVGGGKYVDENEDGHEVCNFLVADDGNVYGHVETIKKKLDRKIRIESVGGAGNSVSGVDVVWTATNPEEGGRRVVGWYRNATIFRERQRFVRPPSKQHAKDQLKSYRICAKAEDAFRLDLEQRQLVMGRGTGWMGRTPWWTPPSNPSKEVHNFIEDVRRIIDSTKVEKREKSNPSRVDRKSPSAATDPYVRYVQAYEVEVSPLHNDLQERFERYLSQNGASELKPNMARVDLRFRNSENGLVLTEIKPCTCTDARFAIRTAIGQLLDYCQRTPEDARLLIVLGSKPDSLDQELALSNGFGIAFPFQKEFQIVWPK
jgi:hypothetical protein